MQTRNNHRKTPVTVLALSIGLALQFNALAALAQEATPAADSTAQTAAPEPVETLDTVTVTGYRASLEKALDIKRSEKGVVDAIVAEDIGKFPDLNLAESLQRIPGVVITRDAGEGRNITVRGLGPQFTRVRLNGMEAMTSVGSSDGQGGANRSRGFDFNVFASDLFSQLIVRKTASADVDEGSLGATVDLRTARPFDYDGFTAAGSLQGSFNDVTDTTDPRFAGLIANSWADGKFGALVSLAYSERADAGRRHRHRALGRRHDQRRLQRRLAIPAGARGRCLCPALPALHADGTRPEAPGRDRRRCSSSPATAPRSAWTRCIRRSTRSATRSTSRPTASARPARTGKPQILVNDGDIDAMARWFTACSTTSTSAPSTATTNGAPTFKQLSLDGEHRFTDNFTVTGKIGTSEVRSTTTRSRRRS